MRRSVWIVVLTATVVAAALTLAGCGAATVDGMTAADVVAKSNDAMQSMKSAAFDGAVKIVVDGDKDKVSDPTSAFLLGAPLSMTMAGVLSEDPVAMDMTIKVPLLAMMSPGAETIRERVIGDHVYVLLRGQWYGMKQPAAQTPTTGPPASASTEQVMGALKRIGVDLNDWVKDRQDLTVEQLGGKDLYRVSEEVDVDAMAAGLAKLLANAGSLEQLVPGDQKQATQQQLDLLRAQSGRIADSLRKYLRGATVDLWIEKDSFYLDKMAFAADIDLPREAADKGMSSVKLSLTFGLSRFNEPVRVEKPAHVKPLAGVSPRMWMNGGASGGLLQGQTDL
jgi:hypothetical protein